MNARFIWPLVSTIATAAAMLLPGVPSTAAQECSPDNPCSVVTGVPGQVYDTDWDGIGDTSESYYGTDPYDDDTDGDGIRDGDEYNDVYARSDPALWDTDGDGLGDGYEVFSNNSDPMLYDTDGDGVPDGADRSPGDPYRR